MKDYIKKAYELGNNMALLRCKETENPFYNCELLYTAWLEGYNYGLTCINL